MHDRPIPAVVIIARQFAFDFPFPLCIIPQVNLSFWSTGVSTGVIPKQRCQVKYVLYLLVGKYQWIFLVVIDVVRIRSKAVVAK